MSRPKKEQYEYVPSLGRYRKRIKDVDGAWMAIYGKTPRELEQKLWDARERIREGFVQRARPLTVAQYAEKWLDLNTAGLKPKTAEGKIGAVRYHIVPIIGDLRLEDVREDDCKRVMMAIADRSKSLNAKVLSVLRGIFRSALANDFTRKDPTLALKGSGKKPKEKNALTEEQQKILLDAVRGTRAEPFVTICLYTGLRREETLALRWECIDLSSSVPALSVRRALRWEHSRPVVSDDLKTDAARRTIPLPPQLVAYLRTIRQPRGFVIGGDAPLSQQQWRNLWRHVTDRMVGEKTYRSGGEKHTFVRELGAKSRGSTFRYTIDFEVTPHLLRHTYCTRLILAGANVKRVQYLMGHADVKVTLAIYAHVLETSPEVMAGEVFKAFGALPAD